MDRSMCHTQRGVPKRRYETRRAAKQALRWIVANVNADATAMNAYRCHECDYFHLGHYPTNPTTRSILRNKHRSHREREHR